MPNRNGGVERQWSESTWGWSPAMGRWSPNFGQPKGNVFFRVSTKGVAPSEAYDYWRDIAYYQFEAHRPPDKVLARFSAQATALATPRGDLFVYKSTAVSGQRTAQQIRADDGEDFSLGIVLSGSRRHRDERDEVTVAGPGGLFCYDASKASRLEWDDHSGIHLWMPRSILRSSVGDIPSASQLIRSLEASPLASFLRSHFKVLAAKIDALSAAERAVVFDQTLEMVLMVLRQVISGPPRHEDEGRAAHFAMAQRIIAEHLSDPTLDPAKIARMLRISRATLYRAFAAHETSVAEYIREVRLREAMCRLTAFRDVPIAKLAAECGFVDPTHFRRLFRARFGMNPSDVRELSNGSTSLPKENPVFH